MNDADDFVAYLESQRSSAIAVFHSFRLKYVQGTAEFHIFLEGADDRIIYSAFVRQYVPGTKFEHYGCTGKSGVIDVRSLIHKYDFDMRTCMFLVDRDYDDLFSEQVVLDEHTYITEHYSVESMLYNSDTLAIILKDYLGLSDGDVEFVDFMEAWQQACERFECSMRPLIAWSLMMRQLGRNINFNNVNLNRVIDRESGEWNRLPNGVEDYEIMSRRRAPTGSIFVIRNWIKHIDCMDTRLWLRGKFALWFLRAFLVARLQSFRTSTAGRRTINLVNSALIETLSGNIKPEASLMKFLDSKKAMLDSVASENEAQV